MIGRRVADQPFRDWSGDEHEPGDFWRIVDKDGKPMHADRLMRDGRTALEHGNLTGGVWGVCTPNGLEGMLTLHTVREHEDGTISVRPGDGSSNSILIDYPPVATWHGYIERGVWSSC